MSRFFYTMFLVLLASYGTRTYAQRLWISSDGHVTDMPLVSVQKMEFSGETLTISSVNGSVRDFRMPAIDKMWFETAVSGINASFSRSENKLLIHLTPVEDKVWISGAETGDYSLMQIDGQVIRRGSYVSGNPLDVSDLQSGLYLLRVNGETCKLRKR